MQGADANPVVLLAIADLHLSLEPPLARSCEDNWLMVQKGYLDQVRRLMIAHMAPLVIAGDLFHRWNPPLELVNWALNQVPKCYAVPGNHDLRNHNYANIHKTGFYTLVKAGLIQLVEGSVGEDNACRVIGATPIRLHGFPCGSPVKALEDPHALYLEVALVHAYIWTKNTGYEGASPKHRARNYKDRTEGYDITIWGDNHIPFEIGNIFNCGAFMRRRITEINHGPSVGLVRADGSVDRHYLDVSKDRFLEPEVVQELEDSSLEDVLEEFNKEQDAQEQFEESLNRYMDRKHVSKRVREIVLQSLEGKAS